MESTKICLEVAIIRNSLESALSIAATQGRAVFGTMDGRVLEKVVSAGAGIPVYFYEPG